MSLESLPNRPLSRSEVDELSDREALNGIFPVYGDREEKRDTCYAFVLVLGTTAYAVSYTGRFAGWEVATAEPIDADDRGISLEAMDSLDRLLDVAIQYGFGHRRDVPPSS